MGEAWEQGWSHSVSKLFCALLFLYSLSPIFMDRHLSFEQKCSFDYASQNFFAVINDLCMSY